MNEPNLQQLRVFEAVVRTGGFSRAAKSLNMSQPAASNHVADLEKVYNSQLLLRLGRTVQTTESGELILAAARRIFSELESLNTEIAELRGMRRGTIVCGVDESLAEGGAAALISRFQSGYPDVRMRMEAARSADMMARVASGEFSFGLCSEPPASETLEQTPIGLETIAVVASATHRFARRNRVPLHALPAERWVLRPRGEDIRELLERFAATHGITLTCGAELGSTQAVKQAIAAGLGIGFLPLGAVEAERAAGSLCVLDIPELTMRRTIAIARLKSRRLTKAEEAFLSLARESSEFPALAAG